MNDNVFRKVGLYARDERCGSKLRKCMVAMIGSNDIMAGLSAAIITHHHAGAGMAGQKIGQEAFPGISKTKIDNDIGSQGSITALN